MVGRQPPVEVPQPPPPEQPRPVEGAVNIDVGPQNPAESATAVADNHTIADQAEQGISGTVDPDQAVKSIAALRLLSKKAEADKNTFAQRELGKQIQTLQESNNPEEQVRGYDFGIAIEEAKLSMSLQVENYKKILTDGQESASKPLTQERRTVYEEAIARLEKILDKEAKMPDGKKKSPADFQKDIDDLNAKRSDIETKSGKKFPNELKTLAQRLGLAEDKIEQQGLLESFYEKVNEGVSMDPKKQTKVRQDFLRTLKDKGFNQEEINEFDRIIRSITGEKTGTGKAVDTMKKGIFGGSMFGFLLAWIALQKNSSGGGGGMMGQG